MWRLFRWLDRHPPTFYKATMMTFSLAAIVMIALLLGRWHPAAGILFGFGALFGLMYSSQNYRYVIKPRLDEEAGDAPAPRWPEPGPGKCRSARTEFWRRQILAAAKEPGKRGDLARSIIKRWKEAEAAQLDSDEDEDDKPRD